MQPAGVSPTSNEPFTGKTVGDYVLRERVGKGTFGSVYRATKSDGTVVAIKIISRAGMLDHNKQPTRLMDQFNKEVDIMRIINHPKIIKFREKLQSENNYYLVLDYCEDGDLKEYIEKRSRMPEGDAIEALKQLATGFKELHRLGIMHRDFKPANVFIHKGNFIIGDLGMAKKAAITETRVGTPITMAPEVREAMAMGGNRVYDSTVDLFSLGVTFYYMLYAKWPWKTDAYLPSNMKVQIGKQLPFPDLDDVSDDTKELLRGMIALRNDRLDWPEFFLKVDYLRNKPKTFLGGGPQEANDKLFDAEVKNAKLMQNVSKEERHKNLQMGANEEVNVEAVKVNLAKNKPVVEVQEAVKKLIEHQQLDKIQPPVDDNADIKYWKDYVDHYKNMIEFWLQQGDFLRQMWKEKTSFPKKYMEITITAYVALINKANLYLVNLSSLLKKMLPPVGHPSIDSYLKTDHANKTKENLERFDSYMLHTFKTAKKGLELEHNEALRVRDPCAQKFTECLNVVSMENTTVASLTKYLEQVLGSMLREMPNITRLEPQHWADTITSRQVVAFMRIYQMTYEMEEFPLHDLDGDLFDWKKFTQRNLSQTEVKGLYYKAKGRLF